MDNLVYAKVESMINQGSKYYIKYLMISYLQLFVEEDM